jgi:hypothetical protein
MAITSDPIERELDEKNQVIAHLTKTLALTRDCLETARVALERIATDDQRAATEDEHERCRQIALETLRHI